MAAKKVTFTPSSVGRKVKEQPKSKTKATSSSSSSKKKTGTTTWTPVPMSQLYSGSSGVKKKDPETATTPKQKDPVTALTAGVTTTKKEDTTWTPAPMSELFQSSPVTTVTTDTQSGKEYVFTFSGPVSSKAAGYISALVSAIGGKRAYTENNSLVVVM